MSRPSVFRAVAALAGVASLVSLVALVSCSKSLQVASDQAAPDQLTSDESLLATLAPDIATIYVSLTCGTDTTFGMFDAATNGKPLSVFMRHPSAQKNQISWIPVQQNVTINTVGNKPGQEAIPIDVVQTQRLPGAPLNATVQPNAGAPGVVIPPFHKDKAYAYSIGVTCKPATGPDVHIVIDPEMIVRRP